MSQNQINILNDNVVDIEELKNASLSINSSLKILRNSLSQEIEDVQNLMPSSVDTVLKPSIESGSFTCSSTYNDAFQQESCFVTHNENDLQMIFPNPITSSNSYLNNQPDKKMIIGQSNKNSCDGTVVCKNIQEDVTSINRVDNINTDSTTPIKKPKEIKKSSYKKNTKRTNVKPLLKKKKINTAKNKRKKSIDLNPNIDKKKSFCSKDLLYLIDCVSLKNKTQNIIITDNEDENDYLSVFKEYPEPNENLLYNPKKLILHHKNAKDVALYCNKINFLKKSWIYIYGSENDIKIYPQNVPPFDPGWNNYKIKFNEIICVRIKQGILFKICEEYKLSKYYSLIVNMIQTNTCNKNNSNLTIDLLFHIICYHFCTAYDLGEGKNYKINPDHHFYNYINNENFNKIFKPEAYWIEKAKFLFECAKEKALRELKISESSFNAFHLYNVLHLIKIKNPLRVAYVFYVFHASNRLELDCNLYRTLEVTDWYTQIIEKRKTLYKIQSEYYDYVYTARSVYNRMSSFY
ncbi:hypothetical protein NUSPORA_01871 [Nucleospora cyclopteri]